MTRAGVPVVDEDRVLARLEDRAIARFRAAQRFLGALALELGRGAHREDLEDRLDELRVRPSGCRDMTEISPIGAPLLSVSGKPA